MNPAGSVQAVGGLVLGVGLGAVVVGVVALRREFISGGEPHQHKPELAIVKYI